MPRRCLAFDAETAKGVGPIFFNLPHPPIGKFAGELSKIARYVPGCSYDWCGGFATVNRGTAEADGALSHFLKNLPDFIPVPWDSGKEGIFGFSTAAEASVDT